MPSPYRRRVYRLRICYCVLKWVDNTPYPRHHFSNAWDDIRALLGRACDRLGIDWRPNNARNLSVARRHSVRRLDDFVGPKH